MVGLEDNICFRWKKPKHGPKSLTTKGVLADGLVSSCQTLTYPTRYLFYHAKINVATFCLTDSRFSVRISLEDVSSCRNITFLQTGVKSDSGSTSCADDTRLQECLLVQDYTHLNTYCEYQCTCSLKASNNFCPLYVNLHPYSTEKSLKLCEILFV